MGTISTFTSPGRLLRAAIGFCALGLVLYAVLDVAAERLLEARAGANPYHRIAVAPAQVDVLILGSSHAMPLAFGGFNETMEQATGLKILNLGTLGAGPLYNRLVLEQFLRGHRTAKVVYVADAFAFQSRTWNEDRIVDTKLLARTPFSLPLARAMARYVRDEGVSWHGWLEYASGFAKINNRDRLQPDRWDAEAQFEREWRPSTSAVRSRIAYLYPAGMQADAQARYLGQLERLVRTARAAGAEVVVIKLPLPRTFHDALPDETAFDAALAWTAQLAGATWHDLSPLLDEPRYFFDSDHLNRVGVGVLFDGGLRRVISDGAPRSLTALNPARGGGSQTASTRP